MDIVAWYFELGNYYWWNNYCNSSIKMTKKEALTTLKRITRDPSIADQFTEEEIEKLEELAARK